MIYVCELCGFEYNPETGSPENGIDPETYFEELPEDWVCPLCGAGKDDFEAVKTDEDEKSDEDL